MLLLTDKARGKEGNNKKAETLIGRHRNSEMIGLLLLFSAVGHWAGLMTPLIESNFPPKAALLLTELPFPPISIEVPPQATPQLFTQAGSHE